MCESCVEGQKEGGKGREGGIVVKPGVKRGIEREIEMYREIESQKCKREE